MGVVKYLLLHTPSMGCREISLLQARTAAFSSFSPDSAVPRAVSHTLSPSHLSVRQWVFFPESFFQSFPNCSCALSVEGPLQSSITHLELCPALGIPWPLLREPADPTPPKPDPQAQNHLPSASDLVCVPGRAGTCCPNSAGGARGSGGPLWGAVSEELPWAFSQRQLHL